jgi:hypothetical protein
MGEQGTGGGDVIDALYAAAKEKAKRQVYVFTVPPKIGGGEWVTLGIVELSPSDVNDATKRCSGDPLKLGQEMPKQSLAEVNGKPVSFGDGSIDATWNKMPAKVRGLVTVAYGKVNSATEEQTADFLDTMTVQVTQRS